MKTEPTTEPPATAAPMSSSTPIYGIIAGDLLPLRSSDANDWAQDFRAYVKLRKLPTADAILLFQTRMTGRTRTWLQGVPEEGCLEDHIACFRQRFGAGDACRPELMTEFWERRQGPDEKTSEYIEDKARLARRPRLPDEAILLKKICLHIN